MDSFLYIILAIIGFFIFIQIFIRLSVLFKKGKTIDGIKGELGDKIKAGQKLLIYFFSPGCSACKHVTPVIDKIKEERTDIYKVDLSKDMELGQKFGVMGTPATIVIENKKISKYVLGAKSESYLRELLN